MSFSSIAELWRLGNKYKYKAVVWPASADVPIRSVLSVPYTALYSSRHGLGRGLVARLGCLGWAAVQCSWCGEVTLLNNKHLCNPSPRTTTHSQHCPEPGGELFHYSASRLLVIINQSGTTVFVPFKYFIIKVFTPKCWLCNSKTEKWLSKNGHIATTNPWRGLELTGWLRCPGLGRGLQAVRLHKTCDGRSSETIWLLEQSQPSQPRARGVEEISIQL